MGWREWLGLTSAASGTIRDEGRPPSGNGASSFHLFWQMPAHEPLHAVSVTFELLDEPAQDRLYFWALQAGFADSSGAYGGAHFGFQWHPQYPDKRAVCWGGYANVGGELDGGPTTFPSIDGNPNVCAYPWTTGQRWTWRIRRIGDGAVWRAELDDPNTGQTVPIRDLYCRGDRLVDPMVWSEVFAHCDDASVHVRWSELSTNTSTESILPFAVSVNYQSYADGGCTNTNSIADEFGFVQATNTERVTVQGAILTR
ncbi:MAG: hypothetical protein ABI658_20865 [Acidimicrobiales bacterium]